MVDLEQLRAFPLAPAATNDINPTLLASLFALFYALSSAINAAIFSALIQFFTRLPQGPRRITWNIEQMVVFNTMIGNSHAMCINSIKMECRI